MESFDLVVTIDNVVLPEWRSSQISYLGKLRAALLGTGLLTWKAKKEAVCSSCLVGSARLRIDFVLVISRW